MLDMSHVCIYLTRIRVEYGRIFHEPKASVNIRVKCPPYYTMTSVINCLFLLDILN